MHTEQQLRPLNSSGQLIMNSHHLLPNPQPSRPPHSPARDLDPQDSFLPHPHRERNHSTEATQTKQATANSRQLKLPCPNPAPKPEQQSEITLNLEQSSPKPPALARQLQKLPELELQPHQEKLPSLQLSGSPPLNNCPTFIQEHLALNDGSSTVIIAETCLYRPTIPQLFPPLPEPNFPPLPPESSHPLNPIPDLPPNSHTPGTSVPVPPERGPLQPPLPQPTAPQTDAPLPTAPLPTAPQPTAPQPNPQQPTTKPAAPQQPAPQQPEAAKKVPVGEREQAALDKEREQYDQLRAEEIYARMEAEKALHEARIQALWQDLQTEIQRIIRETMLHRQKVMDEINKNWHKILIG